jgi:hypothetical protein
VSFLVYDWGVADSYEPFFYRQKKDFVIPVNANDAEELPRSFTFECNGFPVQSYAFKWVLAGPSSSVSVKKLTSAIIVNNIVNRLPISSSSLLPGSISTYVPDIERIRWNISVLQDGRNAHETVLTYRSSIPKDICSAKILDSNGEQQKIEKLGPNYFDSTGGLVRSGFDRLHSWGYVAFKGYKEAKLKLEIECSGAGLQSVEFVHPAPPVPLSVSENGPCPAEYEGTVSSSLKSAQISLTCNRNVDGNFIWVNEKSKTSTPLPKPPTVANESVEPVQKAQIRSILSMGLKVNKIDENLGILRSKLSSKKVDSKILLRIDDLRIQAKDVYTLSKTAVNLTSHQAAIVLAKQVVKGFNSVEEEYRKLVEEIE